MPLNQYTEYKTSKFLTGKTMRIVKTESLALNNQTVWCAILFFLLMCTCKRKSKFTCMYMYIQNHSFKLTMASFIHKIVLQNKAWIERHTVQPYSRLL